MHNRSGFTLLEISIVLVIIGLLASGILVGQMLIKSAELRKAISQRDQFDAAANTFRTKYNCIPGDCAAAYDLGLARDYYDTFTYGQAGNGNDMIGAPGGTEEQSEAPSFWYHLSAAQLINWRPLNPEDMDLSITCEPRGAGPCLDYSTSSADGYKAGWWVHSTYSGVFITNAQAPVAPGNYLWITGTLGLTHASGSAVFIPSEAFDIDSKVDDGQPLTGSVLAAGDAPAALYGPGNATIGAINADMTCIIGPAPSVYNTYHTTKFGPTMCSLLFKASF